MTSSPTRADADFFRRLKVLVVEDSAEMRRLLAALLESMGVEQIFEAPDGLGGLDAFAEHRPDIIITDGSMQPMDGFEMTHRVRAADAADGANPDVPILMISASPTTFRSRFRPACFTRPSSRRSRSRSISSRHRVIAAPPQSAGSRRAAPATPPSDLTSPRPETATTAD